MSTKPKPGDVVWIKVNGVRRKTTIDAHGVQRFPCNMAIDWLVNRADFNELMLWVQNCAPEVEKRRRRDLQRLFMQTGWSVTGFAETFPKAKIENPVWGEP